MSGDVRFVRIGGRIVPIRGKGNGQGGGKAKAAPQPAKRTTLILKVKKTTAGERFKSGFKRFGTMGAYAGGALGGVGGAIAGGAAGGKQGGRLGVGLGAAAGLVAGAAAGAVQGGVSWGLWGGGASAAFGRRRKIEVVRPRLAGRKKK